jgi:site-specific DNA recombinase
LSRRIFRMYAAGHGPVAIAKTMNGDPDYREESKRFFNGERPEKPIVGKRGCGSWAPTAIHAMLRNERYIGVLLYGRMKRGKYRDDGKQSRARQRDSTAIRRAERPELRIVPADLWKTVERRIAAERDAYLASTGGQLFGRPDGGRESKYLLSGLIRCGVCGGSVTAAIQHSGKQGTLRRRLVVYLCGYRNNRGKTACANALRISEEKINAEVIEAMTDVMTPDVLAQAVRRATALAKSKAKPKVAPKSVAQLEKEKANLIAAIRRGGGLDALVAELRVVEESIRAAKAPTAHNLRSVSDARLARHLDAIAADWKKMMGRGGLENRNVIRAFLARPLELFPEGEDHYRLRGEVKVGKTPYGWCRGRDSNPHSVATART